MTAKAPNEQSIIVRDWGFIAIRHDEVENVSYNAERKIMTLTVEDEHVINIARVPLNQYHQFVAAYDAFHRYSYQPEWSRVGAVRSTTGTARSVDEYA